MSTSASDHLQADQRNPLVRLWFNREARSVILQIITIAAVFGFFAFIIDNAVHNLETAGKTFSFGFLFQPSGYDINQHLIPYTSQSTHFRAMLVGLLNTLLVAGCGIVLATILGFIMGIVRLSPNWLANRLVYWVIEFLRNVPVLLQILLVHALIVNSLPAPRAAAESANLANLVFFTNRGFYVPKPIAGDLFDFVLAAFVIGIVFTWAFRRWARKVQDATGKIYPVFWIGVAAIIGFPLVVYLVTGMPLTWEVPEFNRFNFRGGLVLRPEFLALWLALSIYTAAFIAEIVRAGIMAVSYGQWEAAYALGFQRKRTLHLIIVPQALRVIVPPLTSEYLNLTKNSSLAIAVGYMDIVATIGGISLMQTGKEMETMIIVLSLYLIISLVISAVMNWFNRAIKMAER